MWPLTIGLPEGGGEKEVSRTQDLNSKRRILRTWCVVGSSSNRSNSSSALRSSTGKTEDGAFAGSSDRKRAWWDSGEIEGRSSQVIQNRRRVDPGLAKREKPLCACARVCACVRVCVYVCVRGAIEE